jgi:hypothetical protein
MKVTLYCCALFWPSGKVSSISNANKKDLAQSVRTWYRGMGVKRSPVVEVKFTPPRSLKA